MRTRVTDLRGDKIIDSRDVIARFRELDSERDDAKHEDQTLEDSGDGWWTAEGGTVFTDMWEEEQEDEHKALTVLIDEAEGYGDWRHGETLIRDDAFEEYAEQLAEDLGLIGGKSDSWPFTCIDWEAAAEELKADYMSVTFGGTEYWMRA